MNQPVRKAILLGATALTLIAAPMLLSQSAVSDIAAYAKDKGNSGGDSSGGSENGNGGGNGEGNSNNGNGNGGGNGKKVAVTEELTTTGEVAKSKNLKAQLAGLNSLNRNINGLMNSSDKRMALVRGYIQAGAALEAAVAALGEAQALLGELQATLNTYLGTVISTAGLAAYDGATVYDAPTLQGLNDRLTALGEAIALNPDNQAAIDEQTALTAALAEINISVELGAVVGQQGVVNGLQAEVTGLEPLAGDDALRAALLAAANKNRVADAGDDAYLTPEIMAWANDALAKLIDDYQAQQ